MHLKFVWRITPILMKKSSFDSLHISDDIDFSMDLSFVCMNQGGSSWGWSFLGIILGSFWEVRSCVSMVLSRKLIVFARNRWEMFLNLLHFIYVI